MIRYLVNPVNRHYFITGKALWAQRPDWRTFLLSGMLEGNFQGVTTGMHSASGHFNVFRTPMSVAMKFLF